MLHFQKNWSNLFSFYGHVIYVNEIRNARAPFILYQFRFFGSIWCNQRRAMLQNMKSRFLIDISWKEVSFLLPNTAKLGLFRFSPPPSPTDKIIIPPPLADMLSWAVWFKFLLNKVIANTCLFILTSFSKQSASWEVLEICVLCALSTDSRKTYSVNKYMYTGSSSYSFDWGEIIRWGGRNVKDPPNFDAY